MSKIQELIKEKCPKGVEYKIINEICNVNRGRVISKMYLNENVGNYQVYSSQTENNGIFGMIKTYDFSGEYVQWTTDGAKAGSVFYRNGKFSVTNVCGLLKIKDNYSGIISTKFLAYILNTIAKKHVNYATSNPKLMSNVIASVKIPVPPIEVQNEIVRILDKFVELEVELEAELEARKKQYEFYRGKILAGKDRKKYINFGDVAKIVRGASPRPIQHFITKENGVNWIKIGDVKPNEKYITKTKEKVTFDGAKKSRFVKKGEFILSNSMSFGRPYILSIDGCIHDGWLSISEFEKKYLSDFLYHLLSSDFVQKQFISGVSEGTVKNLNAEIVKKIQLPLFDLDDQIIIVRILDKFDELTNSISNGLPAEIEYRRKQYKYYRNKLLSFEELIVNV